MSSSVEPSPRQRLARSLRARLDRVRDDGGFMLVEVMIALSLITVIMAAVGVEFVSGVVSTAHQRSLTNATQLVSTAVAEVRAISPTDLLKGRTKAAVTTEQNALNAIPKVRQWISGQAAQLAYNDDSAAKWATSADNGGSDKTLQIPVPTVATVKKPGNLAYRVYKYVECAASSVEVANSPSGSTTPKQRNCSPTSRTSGKANYLRLIVTAVWNERGCPSVGCAFVTSTLIDGHADPTFDINQALPPAPIVTNPGDQSVAVGEFESLQLLVQDGRGVAPFSSTITGGSLPPGVSMSPAGLISGTVTGSAQSMPAVTVKVTDAFIREASASFKYTVLPRLQFTPSPSANQVSTTGSAITPVTFAGTGGAGGPYTFSDPNSTLPNGLSISTDGTVSGTPTTVGNSSVTLTVADKSGTRAATTTFTWTVNVPPLVITAPANQVDTINRAASLQLSAAGGSGSYRYSTGTLPAGLTLNPATGLISGTVTTLGTTSVTATVTDTVYSTTKSATFSWQIVAPPTVTAPATQNTTRGAAVSTTVSATCPNTPCTYTTANAPTNITIGSSTGVYQGSPTAAANTATNVTVTITDASGASATSSAFTWNVYNAPTITTPATQQDTRTGTDSLTLTSACYNTPCAYSSSGLPKGLSINTSTGLIGGTITTDAASSYSTRLTITDNSGIPTSTNAFTWTIVDPATAAAAADRTSTQNTAVSVDLSTLFSGGSGPFTYVIASGTLPANLALNRTSGVVSGTTAALNSKATGLKVSATDSSGVVTTTSAFTWHVSNLRLNVSNYTLAQNSTVSADLKSSTSGGTTPYSFQQTGLPPGLSMTSAGVVTGKPTTKGTFTATITVADATGATNVDTTTITVT